MSRTIVDVLSIVPMAQVGPPTSGQYRKGDLIEDAAGALWKCQTTGDPGTWAQMASSVDEVVTPTTYRGVEGFELYWDSVSSIKLGVPAVRSIATDASNSQLISYIGQLTANITVSGAGGLDTGVEAANTWYAIYVIFGASGVAALFSTNGTVPVLPVGYTFYRRIGWVRNDASSNFLKFSCSGRRINRVYTFDETRAQMNILLGGAATVFTTVDFSSRVPPLVENVRVSIGMFSKADGDIVGFRPVGSTVALANVLLQFVGGSKTTAAGSRSVTDTKLPLTINAGTGAREIQYALTSNLDVLDLYVVGFEEEI